MLTAVSGDGCKRLFLIAKNVTMLARGREALKHRRAVRRFKNAFKLH